MPGEWWNTDIGGYNNAVNDPGGLGVSAGTPATGITWGQLLSSFANTQYPYGQANGSSMPFAGLPGYQPPKQALQMYQLPVMQQSATSSQQDSGDDWSMVMKAIMSMFGGGAS